jgi:hypothetical protein
LCRRLRFVGVVPVLQHQQRRIQSADLPQAVEDPMSNRSRSSSGFFWRDQLNLEPASQSWPDRYAG